MPVRLGGRIFGGCRTYFWIVAAAVTASDQLTKHLFASTGTEPYGEIVIVPQFLRLVTRPLNEHGMFSLGPQGALFYVIATAVGLGLIGYFFVTAQPDRLCPHIALGSVCGGALGNLVDRFAFGGVRDFIDLHWMDRVHWPTFNIADSAICVGVGLLLWEAFRPPAEQQSQEADEKTEGN